MFKNMSGPTAIDLCGIERRALRRCTAWSARSNEEPFLGNRPICLRRIDSSTFFEGPGFRSGRFTRRLAIGSQYGTAQRGDDWPILPWSPTVVVTVTLRMPDPIHDPQQNHLLAALSAAERERLFPHLQLVPMPLGKVLYESGDLLRHVYFPTDSIVSLLYVLADGASAEISVVGNEGLIGIALFMGGETTPEPGDRAERRTRVPADWTAAQGRVPSQRAVCNSCCCATRRR